MTAAFLVAVGQMVEAGFWARTVGEQDWLCQVGLAAFGAFSGPGGGDLVSVELEQVVGRCF
jgi:hypothetical protein